MIIRHGDPNYALDTLTRKGRKEAALLAKKLQKADIDYFYCSPLGRAKKTMSYTLKKYDKRAKILPWLREFEGRVVESGIKTVCWDRLPSQWTVDERYYTENWHQTELMKQCDVEKEYKAVCRGVDELLKNHGYVHDGRSFKVEKGNHDTVALFCHFGVESVILSHIFSVSPMIFWHNFVALPSSVTTLVTEEREKGTAVFRLLSFGDTGHLYAGNEKLSFAARFCECFEDDTRH